MDLGDVSVFGEVKTDAVEVDAAGVGGGEQCDHFTARCQHLHAHRREEKGDIGGARTQVREALCLGGVLGKELGGRVHDYVIEGAADLVCGGEQKVFGADGVD